MHGQGEATGRRPVEDPSLCKRRDPAEETVSRTCRQPPSPTPEVMLLHIWGGSRRREPRRSVGEEGEMDRQPEHSSSPKGGGGRHPWKLWNRAASYR